MLKIDGTQRRGRLGRRLAMTFLGSLVAAVMAIAVPGVASASGTSCNNGVCVYVYGTGTHVNDVQGYINLTNSPCGMVGVVFDFHYPNGGLFSNNVPTSPCAKSVYSDEWNTDWPSGTVVCVWFTQNWTTRWNNAYPCLTIHS